MNYKNNIKYSSVMMAIIYSTTTFSADLVNPSNIPMATSGPEGVKPNLMFILDDSGSMEFDFLGDEVAYKTTLCRSGGNNFKRACDASSKFNSGYDAPFMAYQFNKQFFNPNVATYDPPVDYQGNSFGNRNLTNVYNKAFTNKTDVVDISKDYKEIYWCSVQSPSTSQLSNTTVCKRNGVDNGNPFNYATVGLPDNKFIYPTLVASVPHYFDINPTEYCDESGVNCSSSSSAATPVPAYVRWCNQSSDATSTNLVTGKNGSDAKCKFDYDESGIGYKYPRFGLFERKVVQPNQATNFANWYSYYRTRMSSMKTAASLAFNKITDNKRVGLVTINAGNNSSKYLPVGDFNAQQKQDFYNKLFSQVGSGSTPLREALSRVGRYYSGFVDSFMITGNAPKKDPIQYSCQKNFTLLSTDGYWNGSNGYDMNGTNLGKVSNPDGKDAGFSKRSDGVYDGGLSLNDPAGGSLADVSQYYYATPLRGTRTTNSDGQYVNDNNVPTSLDDPNSALHMNTYTISLGLNGLMKFTKNYFSGGNADFEAIKNGSANWPKPVGDSPTALDDLWHAAVNGRGRYFSAQNPKDIVSGLDQALIDMGGQTSAAAAAATSSPMMTQGEDKIFASTYRTISWYGDLVAMYIDPATGKINQNPLWSAKNQLQKKDKATRVVKYMDKDSKSLKDFNPTVIGSSPYSQYFNNQGANLSQYLDGSLDTTQKAKLNDQANLINYLKGFDTYEIDKNTADPLYRKRDFVLGDFIDSPAVYVGKSRYSWANPRYMEYAIATSSRQKMVYIGANDGMIHAFNADTGNEMWAVIPSQVMPDLYKLADSQYAVNHKFYVDGQITVMDAFIKGTWRTILISGMGAGGKGYFALDVTDPEKPAYLFEMCKDSTLCSISDPDLGYTYGNPIITQRFYDDQWVAYMTNGYDSANGKGIVYEINLDTLTKRNLTVNTTSSLNDQVGLAQINGLYDNFTNLNKTNTFYFGGLNGNVYKLDTTTEALNIVNIGRATDPSGVPQPITTKVEVGKYHDDTILMFGTGKYLSPVDNSSKQVQSIYAVKDTKDGYGYIRNNGGIVKQSVINSGNTKSGITQSVDWTKSIGWMLDLTGEVGERVNVSPSLAVGTLNVLTNIPATTACTAGGTAWYYQIDFTKGGAIGDKPLAQKLSGGLAVGQVVVRLAGTEKMKNIVTTSDGKTTDQDMYSNAIDTGGGERDVAIVGWREIFNTGNGTD